MYKRLWRATVLLALTIFLGSRAGIIQAQEEAGWQTRVDYEWGGDWQFSLQGTAATGATTATVVVSGEDGTVIWERSLPVDGSQPISVVVTAKASEMAVRPFSTLTYRWELDTSPETAVGPQSMVYFDNRLAWQFATRENMTVAWASADSELGDLILDQVTASLPRLQTYLPVPPDPALAVVVYPTSADLRTGLRLTGQPLVNGHPHPNLEVLLLATASSRTAVADLARQLPQTLAYHYLYQASPDRYDNLPPWLVEGVAANLAGAVDVRYAAVLETAVTGNQLLPLDTLCQAFPTGDDALLLAQAQAHSLVSYIQSHYGLQAIRDLLADYYGGADCHTGLERVVGQPVALLESAWRESLLPQSPIRQFVIGNIHWFLLLLGGVMVTILMIIPTSKP